MPTLSAADGCPIHVETEGEGAPFGFALEPNKPNPASGPTVIDFELAQAHLDILKLATSREIANDAMELSLLITDNLTDLEPLIAFAPRDARLALASSPIVGLLLANLQPVPRMLGQPAVGRLAESQPPVAERRAARTESSHLAHRPTRRRVRL
jgi:hypothetical protein